MSSEVGKLPDTLEQKIYVKPSQQYRNYKAPVIGNATTVIGSSPF